MCRVDPKRSRGSSGSAIGRIALPEESREQPKLDLSAKAPIETSQSLPFAAVYGNGGMPYRLHVRPTPPPQPSARLCRHASPTLARHQFDNNNDSARRLKRVTLRLGSVLGTYPDVWSSSTKARASTAARSWAKVRRRALAFTPAPLPPHTPLGSQETTYVVSCAL